MFPDFMAALRSSLSWMCFQSGPRVLQAVSVDQQQQRNLATCYEMRMLRLPESEARGVGPGNLFEQALQVILVQTQVYEPLI